MKCYLYKMLFWAARWESIHAFMAVAPTGAASIKTPQRRLATAASLSSQMGNKIPQSQSNTVEEAKKDDKDCGCDNESGTSPPDTDTQVLQPYLPAMDPMYPCRGPVGEGSFVLSRTGGPTKEELSDENMLRIVQVECTDLEVNTLVWKCLGYRFDTSSETWMNDNVFPNWRKNYPTPPDFIGMKRVYSREVDEPSLRSNQALVRSIPLPFKQSLKPALKPLGWSGYKYAGLTPNKTRRAQCANWLIYYRDHLFGYTLEELQEQRRIRQEQEQALQQDETQRKKNDTNNQEEKEEEEFRPPVNEVF